MMKFLVAPALLLLAFAGSAAAETRAVSGFNGVKAEDRLRVEVAVGPNYAVDVSGRDADRIRTEIVNDRLEISDRRRPWFHSPRLDAVVRITMPAVESLVAARGATLDATLGGDCSSLETVAAMGASASIRGITCSSVNATAAMGGELNLAGTCGDFDVTAAMGGEVDADALQCRTVDATAAMGGDVAAYASETYDASASMGGSIDVGGNSTRGHTSAVMGGSIDHSR